MSIIDKALGVVGLQRTQHEKMNDIDALMSGWSKLTRVAGVLSWSSTTSSTDVKSAVEAVSKEPIFRRAMDIVNALVADVPIRIYDDTDTEVIEGDLYKNFGKQPNHRQSWYEFKTQLSGWWISTGKNVLAPLRMGNGKPFAIYPVQPEEVVPIVDERNYIEPLRGYRYGSEQKSVEEFIYLPFWTPSSGYYGESPLKGAVEDVAINLKLSRTIKNLADRGLKTDDIFSAKQMLNDQELKLIKSALSEHAGPENAGKPLFMPAPFDLVNRTITPKEAQYVDVKQVLRQTILISTGVSEILFIAGSATYENLEKAMLIIYLFTIIPYLNNLCSRLTMDIAQLYDKRLRFKPDLSGVEPLMARWEKIATACTQLATAGVMSPNEIRRDVLPEGYEPFEGGDIIRRGQIGEVIGEAPVIETPQPAKELKAKASDKSIDDLWGKLTGKKQKSINGITKRKAAGGFSGEVRELEWQKAARQEESFKRKFAEGTAKLYKAQEKKVIAYVKHLSDDLIDMADVEKWVDWGKVRPSGSTGEVKSFQGMAHRIMYRAAMDAAEAYANDRNTEYQESKQLRGLIDEHAGSFAVDVLETTKQKLQFLAKAAKSGKSLKQNEFDIPEEDKEKPKDRLLLGIAALYLWSHTGNEGRNSRAETSGQREMHGAITAGRHDAMVQAGFSRRQVLASMVNTREHHEAWDGQTVAIDEPYISGLGNEVMTLGWSGIAEEDINCQCYEMEALDEE